MGWKDLPHWVKVGFVLSFIFLFVQILTSFLDTFGIINTLTFNWGCDIFSSIFNLKINTWCQSNVNAEFIRYCIRLKPWALIVSLIVVFLIGAVFGRIYSGIKNRNK